MQTGGGRYFKYRPPLGPAVRWIECVRSRSYEVCAGRESVVIPTCLPARGSCGGATPEARRHGGCAQPRRRMSADRRRRRPRRFIVEEKRVPLALGKAFVALRSGEGNGQPVAGFGGPEMLAVAGEPRRRLRRRHPAASCSKPATQGHGARWIEGVITDRLSVPTLVVQSSDRLHIAASSDTPIFTRK